MADWAIIYNPTSGSFDRGRLEEVEKILNGQGITTAIHPTERPGHATEIARSISGAERVVSYGGDGTLNEVAFGLLGRNIPLMFLPGGTGNGMAYEMKIPRHPVKAIRKLLNSRPQPFRPGMVGNRPFLLMVGFGFDATAVYMITKTLKSNLGPAAYVWTGIKALFQNKPELRVILPDGSEFKGVWVVGARARAYAGFLSIHPRAALFKEDLGLTVVTKAMIAPFAFTNLLFGTGFVFGGIKLEEYPSFKIQSDQPFHIHVDGDCLEPGKEFEVTVSDQILPLCMPESS